MLERAAGGLELARSCLEGGWTPPAGDDDLVRDFGALGLAEEQGGFGGGMVDVAIAVEALGRTLVPSRLPAHLAAVQAAACSGIDVAAALEGRSAWSVALTEAPAAGPVPALFGDAVDAVVAPSVVGTLLLPARPAEPRSSLDPTRPCAAVEAGRPAGDGPAADAALRVAVVAAAELCGAGRGAVELGAAYARDREQFGRPIGSFQGVAFQLADAFVAVKAAWDLTLYAAWALDVGDAAAPACVHGAKAKAGQAAVLAAERALQVHGGIGMTWEADPHLYLRRALFGDAWAGDGRRHRLALGRLRVGLEPDEATSRAPLVAE